MEWRIIFPGLQSPGWAATAILIIAAAIGISVWLLRAESKRVSFPVGAGLMVLRCLSLVLLLLILLQPQIVWQLAAEGMPGVVVAVDVSGSMQSSDRHAEAAELIDWAQALGLMQADLSADVRQRWIDEWTADADEDGAAAASSRQVRQLLDDMGRLTRKQFVGRLLGRANAPLLRELQETSRVELLTFAAAQQLLSEDNLDDVLQSDMSSATELTDIAAMLNRVLTLGQPDTPRSVVLFSDGRHTGRGNAVDVARQLGSLDVPVYVVPIGSERLPRDLIARPVDAPSSIFPDDQTTVRSRIAAAGYNGQSVTVRLRHAGRLLEEIQVPVQDDFADAGFVLPSLPAGHHDLSIDVGILPGELSEDNNEQEFSIAVVDNRARVMLIDEDPRWEFRYLKNLLSRDQRIDLVTILFEQPYLEILDGPALPQRLPSLDEFREQLARTDLLLLGDVGVANLPVLAWGVISNAVAEEGLTVVMIPGRQRISELLPLGTLQELLPVESPHSLRAEGFAATPDRAQQSAFRLVPRPAAERLPMFQLQPGTRGPAASFAELPGHPWILSGTPRPAATEWASAVIQTTSGEKSFPLIVHQYFGSGQVIWMGMDSTWRWRRRAGDKWHQRFWGQLVRWAVRNKSAIGNNDVRLVLSSEFISAQQAVDVSVRWSSGFLDRLDDQEVRVVVDRVSSSGEDSSAEEKESRSFVLQPGKVFPDRFSTQLSGLTEGRYRVSLDPEGLPFPLSEPIQANLSVLARATPELTDISCDREYLARIAEASGGELLEPSQLSTLPRLLVRDDTERVSISQPEPLWDRWEMLVAFFFLLTLQWVVRKTSGLP